MSSASFTAPENVGSQPADAADINDGDRADGEDKPPVGTGWSDNEEEDVWMYKGEEIWQQVQRKINKDINEAKRIGMTELDTSKLSRNTKRDVYIDLNTMTMKKGKHGKELGRLEAAKLRDVKYCRSDVSEPIWQYANNWGWESFRPDLQESLEAAFGTAQGTVDITHQWITNHKRKVTDSYKVGRHASLYQYSNAGPTHRKTNTAGPEVDWRR